MKDKTKYSKKALHICLIVAGIAAVSGVVLVMVFVDFVPPISQTGLAMRNCKERIQQYALEHNALPASLNDTKEIKGAYNSNKDGWGHDIIYSADANGLVTLTSLGKDNKPGGKGNDTDITGTYQSHRMSGGWASPAADWIKNPYSELRHPKK